jgi:dynein heavy chain
MTNIDPMYQYSLQWFINIYKQVIETSEPNEDLDIRLQTLIYNLTLSIYNNVCQSLFEKDKLLFSFLLSIRILQGKNSVNEHEWRFLLTGGIKTEKDEDKIKDRPINCSWLTDKSWSEVVLLSNLDAFEGFSEDFKNVCRKKDAVSHS